MQDTYNLENPTAVAGMVETRYPGQTVSRIAAVGLEPGTVVVFDPDATDPDTDLAYLPSAGTDITGQAIGIVVFDWTKEATPEGDPMYAAGEPVQILAGGVIWVSPEDIISAPGPVHVRHVAAAGESLGRMRGAADGTDTAVLPTGRFMDVTSAANGLSRVNLNLP